MRSKPPFPGLRPGSGMILMMMMNPHRFLLYPLNEPGIPLRKGGNPGGPERRFSGKPSMGRLSVIIARGEAGSGGIQSRCPVIPSLFYVLVA